MSQIDFKLCIIYFDSDNIIFKVLRLKKLILINDNQSQIKPMQSKEDLFYILRTFPKEEKVKWKEDTRINKL